MTEILNGDFEHGLGIFHASVSADAFDHVAYYLSVKRRREIIRLHDKRGNRNGSSVSFNEIAAFGKALRIVFSYYAISMEERGLHYRWRIALAFEAVLARREGLRQREVV